MPSYIGPNTSGEENLVFAYDLDNRDNSYKNPPAVNLVHRDVARGSNSGWDGYGVHTGYGLINHGTVEKDGRPDTIAVTWTDQGSGTQTGDWYPRFYLRNPDGSLVTTTGGEVFYATWEYKYEGEEYLTSGGADYNTENFYGNGWKSGVHGSIDRLYIEELPLGWKRRVARIVAGDSGTVQTPLYRFGSGYKRANGGDFTLWLDNITITRDYPVHSWFPGQSEITPSEGLLDLTGNSTIDLTNVSFDSNAQMTFDGTDDYVNLGDNSAWDFGQNGTLEIVVRPTNSTGNDRLWCIDNNSSNLDAYLNSSGYNVYMHGGVVGTTTPLIQNQYNHLVVVYNGGTIQIYINGVAGTMTGTTTGYNITNPSANNSNLYLGCYRNLGYNLYGDINLFKVYNRALTALEIKANFNALKGRFNIA